MPSLFDVSTLGLPALAALATIYAGAAVFSGLSGFGFSAIGSLSLLLVPPCEAVPLLMALSLVTQAASFGSLRAELRQHLSPWHRRDGVVPYLLGGTVGMPLGLALLATIDARSLTELLGGLLMAYAAWALLKPAKLRLANAAPSVPRSFLVGATGGVVGGFSAFPGSALVVFSGLAGIGKEQGRALIQPFVLWMQSVGLGLLLATRPQLFDRPFWLLLAAAAPVALVGNRAGVAIYRRTGDRGYRQVTLIALGISGLGLVVKVLLLPGA